MSQIFKFRLALISALYLAAFDVSGADLAQCENLWREIASKKERASTEDYQALLTEWKTIEGQCKGTGTYEVRLASIYMMLDENESAKKSLSGVDIPSKYQAAAETILINSAYIEALSSNELNIQTLKQVESRASVALTKNPEQVQLYGLLGHVRLLVGNYSGAIDALEKDIKQAGSDGSIRSYRNLAIAYTEMANYDKAIHSGDRAYAISKNVTSDVSFMSAMAISYAAIGKIDSAKNVLTLILSKKPELQNDPKFRKTVEKAKRVSGGKLQ